MSKFFLLFFLFFLINLNSYSTLSGSEDANSKANWEIETKEFLHKHKFIDDFDIKYFYSKPNSFSLVRKLLNILIENKDLKLNINENTFNLFKRGLTYLNRDEYFLIFENLKRDENKIDSEIKFNLITEFSNTFEENNQKEKKLLLDIIESCLSPFIYFTGNKTDIPKSSRFLKQYFLLFFQLDQKNALKYLEHIASNGRIIRYQYQIDLILLLKSLDSDRYEIFINDIIIHEPKFLIRFLNNNDINEDLKDEILLKTFNSLLDRIISRVKDKDNYSTNIYESFNYLSQLQNQKYHQELTKKIISSLNVFLLDHKYNNEDCLNFLNSPIKEIRGQALQILLNNSVVNTEFNFDSFFEIIFENKSAFDYKITFSEIYHHFKNNNIINGVQILFIFLNKNNKNELLDDFMSQFFGISKNFARLSFNEKINQYIKLSLKKGNIDIFNFLKIAKTTALKNFIDKDLLENSNKELVFLDSYPNLEERVNVLLNLVQNLKNNSDFDSINKLYFEVKSKLNDSDFKTFCLLICKTVIEKKSYKKNNYIKELEVLMENNHIFNYSKVISSRINYFPPKLNTSSYFIGLGFNVKKIFYEGEDTIYALIKDSFFDNFSRTVVAFDEKTGLEKWSFVTEDKDEDFLDIAGKNENSIFIFSPKKILILNRITGEYINNISASDGEEFIFSEVSKAKYLYVVSRKSASKNEIDHLKIISLVDYKIILDQVLENKTKFRIKSYSIYLDNLIQTYKFSGLISIYNIQGEVTHLGENNFPFKDFTYLEEPQFAASKNEIYYLENMTEIGKDQDKANISLSLYNLDNGEKKVLIPILPFKDISKMTVCYHGKKLCMIAPTGLFYEIDLKTKKVDSFNLKIQNLGCEIEWLNIKKENKILFLEPGLENLYQIDPEQKSIELLEKQVHIGRKNYFEGTNSKGLPIIRGF